MATRDPYISFSCGREHNYFAGHGSVIGSPDRWSSCNCKGDLAWVDLCEELLGLRPDQTVLQGANIKLHWLQKHFLKPPPDASDVTLERYARAHLLGLIGSVLFPDKTGADVHLIYLPLLRNFAEVPRYSWGSASLAFLNHELCGACKMGVKEIAGLSYYYSYGHGSG